LYYVDDNRAAKADFRRPKLLPQNPGNMNKFPAYFRACLLANTTRRVGGESERRKFLYPFCVFRPIHLRALTRASDTLNQTQLMVAMCSIRRIGG